MANNDAMFIPNFVKIIQLLTHTHDLDLISPPLSQNEIIFV
jgi:hypothetical protein